MQPPWIKVLKHSLTLLSSFASLSRFLQSLVLITQLPRPSTTGRAAASKHNSPSTPVIGGTLHTSSGLASSLAAVTRKYWPSQQAAPNIKAWETSGWSPLVENPSNPPHRHTHTQTDRHTHPHSLIHTHSHTHPGQQFNSLQRVAPSSFRHPSLEDAAAGRPALL